MNKKAFQKIIKTIRDERPQMKKWGISEEMMSQEYPKAMMTAVQMGKKTATVNCDRKKEVVDLVLNDSRFIKLMTESKAKALIETNSEGYIQIRITY